MTRLPIALHRPSPSAGTRVVKRAELADALPADTATVTATERTAAMWVRFNGIRQRYEPCGFKRPPGIGIHDASRR